MRSSFCYKHTLQLEKWQLWFDIHNADCTRNLLAFRTPKLDQGLEAIKYLHKLHQHRQYTELFKFYESDSFTPLEHSSVMLRVGDFNKIVKFQRKMRLHHLRFHAQAPQIEIHLAYPDTLLIIRACLLFPMSSCSVTCLLAPIQVYPSPVWSLRFLLI